MPDLIALLEKARPLWPFVRSRRFVWPAILCVVGVLYGVLDIGGFVAAPLYNTMVPAIISLTALVLLANATIRLPHEKRWLARVENLLDASAHDKAAQSLSAPPPLMGFAARAAQQVVLVRLKIETGDLLAAYQALIAAEKTVLLPSERLPLRLSKAQLLFNAGNYAAFGQLLTVIDAAPPANGKPRIRYLLLQSLRCELAGSYAAAKSLIEEVIELAASPGERIRGYNNLARLEAMQGNHLNAQSYYEQAWAQLQASPVPALYPVVLHNLMLSYAMQHAHAKALSLLATYRQAVKPDNVAQVQELLSDQTHLARQLGDRALLLDAYTRAQTELVPLLSTAQRFAIAVSELRMRMNDGVDFAGHFNKTIAQFAQQTGLTPVERFNVLSQIMAVCQQDNGAQLGPAAMANWQKASAALLAMEDQIADQLRSVPPQLPTLRDKWHQRQVELIKLKIVSAHPPIPKPLVTALFVAIQERRQLWADKQNPVCALEALIVMCDEYIAYRAALGPAFVHDYQSQAQAALRDAGQIAQAKWPHPSMIQYAFGLAYFYWQIVNRAELAATWLTRFNQSGLSLAHSAAWLRQQHVQLTAWLADKSSHPNPYLLHSPAA